MAERGTYLVADVWAGDWMEEEGTKDELAGRHHAQDHRLHRDTAGCLPTRARSTGVRIGFGTDSGIYPHGMNIHQLAKHGRARHEPDGCAAVGHALGVAVLGQRRGRRARTGPLRRPCGRRSRCARRRPGAGDLTGSPATCATSSRARPRPLTHQERRLTRTDNRAHRWTQRLRCAATCARCRRG